MSGTDGDRATDPSRAVPGLDPGPGSDLDDTTYTVEVDGQMFAVRASTFGGSGYTWLNGPNPGYGFGLSPTPDWSLEQHRAAIRDFLAQVDPVTGYLEDE